MKRSIVLLSLGALTTSTGVFAETLFHADLTPGQESSGPAFTTATGTRPASFGTADFVLNDAQTRLTFTATIFNIDVTGTQTPDMNDNLLAAHIHAPAPPGQNTGVRWGFFGAPFNDNNPNDSAVTPFTTGVGGMFSGAWDLPEGNNTTLAAQLPNILADLAYINFHTAQNPSGEIRGQIINSPDAGSTAFLLTGSLLAISSLRLRRR